MISMKNSLLLSFGFCTFFIALPAHGADSPTVDSWQDITVDGFPQQYTDSAANTQGSPKTLKTIDQEELDLLVASDGVIVDLINQISSTTIRTKNPAELIAAMTKIRTITEPKIAELQTTIITNQEPFSATERTALIKFNRTLMRSIETFLNDNFEKPMQFEITRSPSTSDITDTAELAELHEENVADSKKLQSRGTNAGLAWYNKLYRAVRPYTIAPAIKHSRLLEFVACGALLATYLIHDLPQDGFDKSSLLNRIPGLATIKGFMGDAARMKVEGPGHYRYDPSSATTKPGVAIGWLNRLMGTNDPVGAKLFNYLVGAGTIGYVAMRPKIAEKFTQLDNFMLGGVHRKQNTLSAYIPQHTLDSIIGMETEKQQARMLIDAILDPEKFARVGANPPGTVLFIGGSRAGKTYFAEAIGGEIALRSGKNDDYFFKVHPSNIADSGGFDRLVYLAQKSNVRVLFIDEFHRYFKHGNNQELLNGALTAFNQPFDPKNPMIIICATNDPAALPHDLRNRFEVTVRFTSTVLNERAQYLTQELHKSGITLDEEALQKLVFETHNCSFEALQRLIKAAKRHALADKKTVSLNHLLRAFDTEIRGIIFDDKKVLSPETRTIIATSIAGETLMRLSTEELLNEKVSVATVLPCNVAIKEQNLAEQWQATAEGNNNLVRHGNVYSLNFFDPSEAATFEQLNAQCQILLAGYVAEKLMFGNCSYSYRPDLQQKALTIAMKIVSKGTKVADLTPEVRASYEKLALEHLNKVEKEVTDILSQCQDQLTVIMILLSQHSLLRRDALLECLDPKNVAEFMQMLEKQAQTMQQQQQLPSMEQPEGLDNVVPAELPSNAVSIPAHQS